MNRLSARFYDRVFRASEKAGLSDARRKVLRGAHGTVLEIGAGTGLNLRAYPRAGIERLVLLEPDDPSAVLAEVARVLRPGGHYLFYEHVRSDDPKLARWQDRAGPLWTALSGGCHCNRRTLETIEASPLLLEHAGATRFPKAFPLVRPAITGSAVLPA